MVNFEQLYFQLFAAMEDAVAALEKGEPSLARDILIRAQLHAEELYISDEE